MFLVDPNIRVISTAHVPPQRKDWWAIEVRKINSFNQLPQELFDRIIDLVDGFPMSWDQAVAIRESLMDERGTINSNHEANLFDVSRPFITRLYVEANSIEIKDTFSFCEH